MPEEKKVEKVVERAAEKVVETAAEIRCGDAVVATTDFTLFCGGASIARISKGQIIEDAGAISLMIDQKKPVRRATKEEAAKARE